MLTGWVRAVADHDRPREIDPVGFGEAQDETGLRLAAGAPRVPWVRAGGASGDRSAGAGRQLGTEVVEPFGGECSFRYAGLVGHDEDGPGGQVGS
jgi:hypothetical protein